MLPLTEWGIQIIMGFVVQNHTSNNVHLLLNLSKHQVIPKITQDFQQALCPFQDKEVSLEDFQEVLEANLVDHLEVEASLEANSVDHLEVNLVPLEANLVHLEVNLGHQEANLVVDHLEDNLVVGHLEANLEVGHLEANLVVDHLEANLVDLDSKDHQGHPHQDLKIQHQLPLLHLLPHQPLHLHQPLYHRNQTQLLSNQIMKLLKSEKGNVESVEPLLCIMKMEKKLIKCNDTRMNHLEKLLEVYSIITYSPDQ